MKPLPAIAAALITALLVLSPALASATGTITITSPAPGSAFKGTDEVTIAGNVAPAATGINVGISVTNPTNVNVLQYNAATDPTTGGFSFSFEAGSSNQWTSGTYTITVSAPGYSSAQETFSYISSIPSTSYNVTKALIEILNNETLIESELQTMNNTLNSVVSTQASQGVTLGDISTALAALSNVPAQLTSISNTLTTLGGTLTTVSGDVSSIQTAVNGLSTTLGNVQTAVTGLGNTLTTIQGTLSSISTSASAAQTAASGAQTAANTAATDASNASSAVSSTQTYVLAVAVLVAITLVLELAVLVRKLS